MAAPYNLTNITASNTTLADLQAISQLSEGILGNGWSIVFFIISFTLAMAYTNDFRKSLIFAGAFDFVLSGLFLLAAGLVTFWLPILYLVLMIIGIILMQDKDLST